MKVHSPESTVHSQGGYINVPITDEASGMDEIERRQLEAARREWRGFWTGLLIALALGVTILLVIFAAFIAL